MHAKQRTFLGAVNIDPKEYKELPAWQWKWRNTYHSSLISREWNCGNSLNCVILSSADVLPMAFLSPISGIGTV